MLMPEHGSLRQLRVLDASGRLVQSKSRVDGFLDLSAQASSAYIIQIVAENGTWNQRLMR
ncbi:MAG TPA: T9SS type A sorting domain-containing protein, partial [Flavobacteriales bacterium]|nr:T9SS type A sorting domain-containing protein [Flavobacteriales bacterium]